MQKHINKLISDLSKEELERFNKFYLSDEVDKEESEDFIRIPRQSSHKNIKKYVCKICGKEKQILKRHKHYYEKKICGTCEPKPKKKPKKYKKSRFYIKEKAFEIEMFRDMGFNYSQIAEKIGCSIMSISRYFKGKQNE